MRTRATQVILLKTEDCGPETSGTQVTALKQLSQGHRKLPTSMGTRLPCSEASICTGSSPARHFLGMKVVPRGSPLLFEEDLLYAMDCMMGFLLHIINDMPRNQVTLRFGFHHVNKHLKICDSIPFLLKHEGFYDRETLVSNPRVPSFISLSTLDQERSPGIRGGGAMPVE